MDGWVEVTQRGPTWTYQLVVSLLHGPDHIGGFWDRLDELGSSLFARIVTRSFASPSDLKMFAGVNAQSYSVGMACATYRKRDQELSAIWDAPTLSA